MTFAMGHPPTLRGMDTDILAFIGGGNMAGALIGGLLQRGIRPEQLIVIEPWAAQREKLAAQFGLQALAAAGPALARASRANRPAMPWPISAGVLGIARTMRWLPVAATTRSLRMPAITDSCSAPVIQSRQGWACLLYTSPSPRD